jgi:MFS transporter, PAT family, beta-lactamase induction signal transducer AmpG
VTSSPAHPGDPERPTPPALYLLLDLPYGAAVGYLELAVPFWLAGAGVPLAEIAALSAAAFMPHALKILWVPLLDLGARRKVWYLGMISATAALLVALSVMPDPVHHLGAFAVLLTAVQVTATTGHAALNALIAITTRDREKGKAAGFYMASNVGGTSLLGALALWLGGHATPTVAGIVLATVALGTGWCGIAIVEPRLARAARAGASVLREAGRTLAALARDLWQTVKSREGFTGLVICAAPVGCGALTNLFSGMALHYRADAGFVAMVNGLGGGIVSAAGALLGGVLADRMSRRLAYALSGGLTALCAVAMLVAPLSPTTYAWGTLTYSFANGIAFATWAGMVLEMVGHTAAVTTKYALFNATANQAISYVTFLDGKVPEWMGWPEARGALATDAVLTGIGISILAVMVMVTRRPARVAPLPLARDAG